MRKRDRHSALQLEVRPDALEVPLAEEPLGGESTHGDDQLWPQQAQLLLPPGRAEALLDRSRRPVAAARRGPARVAARHRRAVEHLIERALVELEPAA